MKNTNIIPVLIGADLNCYNLARAFHEACGVVSYAFGRYEIGATKASRIVRFHTVEQMDSDAVFLQELTRFAQEHRAENTAMIALGCTDDYANMLSRHKAELEALGYIVPYNDIALMDEFASKERFYDFCEKHQIPYPNTSIVHTLEECTLRRFEEAQLGFSYPIVVKPANSIVYWKHPFEQMHKVYFADTPQQAMEICRTIFGSGYDDSIILQDTIPGNDSHMYVLTAYCGQDKKVRMMCLGHVLLEEHTPKGKGNHAAIITEYNPELCQRFKDFLEDIGYVGFANFDIKYDERDGSYRAFEINLRQGRSNYYVTAAGANIAQCLLDDYIEHKPAPEQYLVKKEHFWSYIPKQVVYRYARNPKLVAKAKALEKSGAFSSSLWYHYDMKGNPVRFFYSAANGLNHFKKYRKYMK